MLATSAVSQGIAAEPVAQEIQVDPRVREFIPPVRVVWQSPNDQSIVAGAETLLRARDGQATLGGGPACRMENRGKAPGVLLDFGRELHGGV
jgi:hypothetical protein